MTSLINKSADLSPPNYLKLQEHILKSMNKLTLNEPVTTTLLFNGLFTPSISINAAATFGMMLVILFSLTSMETLKNLLQTNSGASSQICCSVDADTWCKQAPNAIEMNLKNLFLLYPICSKILTQPRELMPFFLFITNIISLRVKTY